MVLVVTDVLNSSTEGVFKTKVSNKVSAIIFYNQTENEQQTFICEQLRSISIREEFNQDVLQHVCMSPICFVFSSCELCRQLAVSLSMQRGPQLIQISCFPSFHLSCTPPSHIFPVWLLYVSPPSGLLPFNSLFKLVLLPSLPPFICTCSVLTISPSVPLAGEQSVTPYHNKLSL